MGAWGTGVLENDGAWDLLNELEGSPSIARLLEALRAAADGDDYLDREGGEEVHAAAEIVAAALGRPLDGVDAKLTALAVALPELAQARELALEALDGVLDTKRSETAELWEDSEDYDDWLEAMADLKGRLQGDG
jgi:hypothetical protein